jgi:hypothetical protein
MVLKPPLIEPRHQGTNGSRVEVVRASRIDSMPTPIVAPTIQSSVRIAQRPTVTAPLTARALAMKAPAAADQRPVVHVTIDRIDVRAPAEAAAPKPPSRPRATTSVSLNDYLRGYDERRRGGGS